MYIGNVHVHYYNDYVYTSCCNIYVCLFIVNLCMTAKIYVKFSWSPMKNPSSLPPPSLFSSLPPSPSPSLSFSLPPSSLPPSFPPSSLPQSLVVLEYLVKSGSQRVVAQCKDNLFSIETLKDFQFLDKDGKDQGVAGKDTFFLHLLLLFLLLPLTSSSSFSFYKCNSLSSSASSSFSSSVFSSTSCSFSAVREKARSLVSLLKNDDQLQEERQRATQVRNIVCANSTCTCT